MDPIDKIREEGRELRAEVRERTTGYILAAFGLVAGLAWNDAIKSLIEYVFPAEKNSLWAQFSYAILITVAVVVFSVYLLRWSGFKKDKPQ